MPPADEPYTILVCSCGKRLKAPGASPGRVGRCPSCGGTLRAPGVEAPSPRPEPAAADDDVLPTRVGTKVRKPKIAAGPVGREGLVRPPKTPGTSLAANILYPIWDGNGLAMILFVSPPLWISSMLSLGLIPNYVIKPDRDTREGLAMVMGALTLIFPMLLIMTAMIGYLCTFLGNVIRQSAFGDLHHPRVPAWQTGTIVYNLMHWGCATFAGWVVVCPLLMLLTSVRGPVGLEDTWIVAILAAPGVIYASVALVAILLFDSLVAANPATVLRVLAKGGASSLKLAVAMPIAVGVTAEVGALLFRLADKGLLLLLGGVWLYWVAVLYEAMVIARMLGVYYHAHAQKIGWFKERPQWGAR